MVHTPEQLQEAFRSQWRPLDKYVPTWGIYPMHVSQSKLRFMRKPNQVGGTTGLVVEIWWDMLRIHPWRAPIPLSEPALPFIVMLKDLDGGYSDFCARLWEWGYRDQLHADCRYLHDQGFYVGRRRLLKLKNGQTLEFRSGTQNLQALESITAAAGYIDEPPRERHFDAFLQRLSFTDGPVLMQFTPVNAGDLTWLRHRIEGDEELGIEPQEQWDQIRPRLTVAHCTTIHGDVIRDQVNIDAAIAKMSPWQVQQRRDGAWQGDTEGRRFIAFAPRHLTDDHSHYPTGMEFRLGMDHGEGDGKQITVLVGCDLASRSYYVLGEWSGLGATTPADVASGVRGLLESVGLDPYGITCYGDINSAGFLGEGKQYNEHIEAAIAEEYGHRYSPLTISTPDKRGGSVNAGETAIHHAIREDRLYVHKSCTRLINAIQNYTGPKDRDLKDPIDALRYAVHDLLRATPATQPRIYIG